MMYEEISGLAARLTANIRRVIVGKEKEIRLVLTALLDVNIFLVLILAAILGIVWQVVLAKEHGKEEK